MFDLHDIFVGSYIANRLVRNAKKILLDILEQRKDINLEQSYEINSLLSTEAIRGSKVMLRFEVGTKEIREKLASQELKSKVEGLNDLNKVLATCYNY
jgi:hypothetical protein